MISLTSLRTLPKKSMPFLLFAIHTNISIQALTLWEKYPVDFYESMSGSKFFDAKFAKGDRPWVQAFQAYTRGMHKEYTHDKIKIPPIFHLIWLGSEIPQKYWELAQLLEKLHPVFSVIIWDDAMIKTLPIINRDKLEASKNYAEKSDIVRYEILYQQGGVYLDGDHFIFQPLTELFYICDFFCGCLYDSDFSVNNAFIGTIPKHPIIKRCIDTISKTSWDGDFMKTPRRSGPYLFSQSFVDEYSESRVDVPFPIGFFSPLPYYLRDEQNKSTFDVTRYKKAYSIAMHKWEWKWTKVD